MSKFENDKVMPRYFIIAVVLTIIGLTVVGKAAYIMTAKKDYWEQVASRLKRDSVSVKPNRGNILSCDGQLMASSIPEYKIFMDFVAGGEKKDSLLTVKMDSICMGLNHIFPSKSAEEFRKHLEEGRKKQAENETARNVRELEDFLDGWFEHHNEPCPRKRLEEAFGVSAKTINRRVELSDKYRRSESKNTPAAVVKVDC